MFFYYVAVNYAVRNDAVKQRKHWFCSTYASIRSLKLRVCFHLQKYCYVHKMGWSRARIQNQSLVAFLFSQSDNFLQWLKWIKEKNAFLFSQSDNFLQWLKWIKEKTRFFSLNKIIHFSQISQNFTVNWRLTEMT